MGGFGLLVVLVFKYIISFVCFFLLFLSIVKMLVSVTSGRSPSRGINLLRMTEKVGIGLFVAFLGLLCLLVGMFVLNIYSKNRPPRIYDPYTLVAESRKLADQKLDEELSQYNAMFAIQAMDG